MTNYINVLVKKQLEKCFSTFFDMPLKNITLKYSAGRYTGEYVLDDLTVPFTLYKGTDSSDNKFYSLVFNIFAESVNRFGIREEKIIYSQEVQNIVALGRLRFHEHYLCFNRPSYKFTATFNENVLLSCNASIDIESHLYFHALNNRLIRQDLFSCYFKNDSIVYINKYGDKVKSVVEYTPESIDKLYKIIYLSVFAFFKENNDTYIEEYIDFSELSRSQIENMIQQKTDLYNMLTL